MNDRKSVLVSAVTHQQLERLGAKYDLSHKDLVGAMAQFFITTKADPRDLKADVPDVALKKLTEKVDGLDKRMIGFIREQERELLKPILAEVRALRPLAEADSSPQLGITAEHLEEQLTAVVGAVQTLIRLSFRSALVDNALRPEYRSQADAWLNESETPTAGLL
jgi:hypothetical protein